MTALEYLKDLPCFFINVETATARYDQFMTVTAPLFGEVNQVAVEETLDDGNAYAWRDMTKRTVEDNDQDLFGIETSFTASNKHLGTNPKTRLLYARTMSVYHSHRLALARGLRSGHERFMILEDDAVPRVKALEWCKQPPLDSTFNIWGGALKMGAHKTDNRAFQRAGRIQWQPIQQDPSFIRRLYCATAYELTANAADIMLEDTARHPIQFDVCWWYSMLGLGAERLVPTGFVQHGPSLRSTRINHESVTEVSE
jgi:GR25 family glycosyltransferase involved in LPS biosynthesis